MRFSCESCGAQYMISDEKVGPGGVKVRCKKCGDVIRVRRAGAAPEEGAGAAAGVEAATPTPGVAQMEAEPAREALAAGVAAPQDDADAAVEWYVAIDDRQVGPLHGSALRKRWDAGEIGPDTLAWRAGMGDWSPVSTIPELARRLASASSANPSETPVPGAGGPAATGTVTGAQNRAVAASGHGALNGTANGKVTAWQPSAGSALASLASQELSTAEKQATPAPAVSSSPVEAPRSGASLLDNVDIPEGGVDPTHLVPLPMKGLEKTTEVVLKPKPLAEHEPTQIRQLKKTAKRSGIAWGVTVASVAALAIAAGFWFLNARSDRSAPVARAPVEAQPAPSTPPPTATPTPPPAPATPPAAVAVAPVPSTPAATPAPAPAASTPAPAPEPSPAAAEPHARPEPVAAAPVAEPEKPALSKRQAAKERAARERAANEAAAKEAAVARAKARREARLAAAERAPKAVTPPAPAPVAEAPRKKSSGDPLLDTGGDGELEKELSSTRPKRNVYVPPAIGTDLPENVSVSQINEAVVGQKAALLRCIEEQRTVDPNARGTLKMRWVIAGDGSPRDVRVVSDEFAKQPIAPCISNVVKGIKFPRSRTTGQEVVFPFKF